MPPEVICSTPSWRALPRALGIGLVRCCVLSGSLGTASLATAGTCLKWSAPEASGCPTSLEIEAAVESVLGRKVFATEHCERTVEGSVFRPGIERWAVDMSFWDQRERSLGTRRLEGPSSCSALRGPVSLVIALTLEAAQESVELSEPTKPAVPRHEPEAPRERAYDWVYAGVRTTAGLLPGLGLGIAIGTGAELLDGLAAHVEGTLWAPKTTQLAGPGGRFWAWHAGLDLCPSLMNSTNLWLSLCGGAQLGLIQASGLGLDYSQSARRPYAHLEAKLSMSTPVWNVIELTAQIGVAIPSLRPRFVYLDQRDAATEVHRPGEFLALAGLGLVWRSSARIPRGAKTQ